MPHPYENIPPILTQQPNWVAWGIQGAMLKTPYNPASLLSGRPFPAKAGVRETWGSYQSAVTCVAQGLAKGIGYEFDGRNDIYGVDLDHVINADGVTLQAREMVDKLSSYTEISPSGTGLHILVFAPGAEINHHRKKDGFVEIYNEARYFTVTGHIYGGKKSIERRTAELQRIHDIYLLPEMKQAPTTITPPTGNGPMHRSMHVPLQDSAEAERFLRTGLERDKVFASLWAGERRNGNESADDIALMNKLAYWCNTHPDVMIRAFLSSPYYAQKDTAHTKKCQRTDYLTNTAKKSCATVYSTAVADYNRWMENRKQKGRVAR